jgi:hypothetical protein
VNLFVGKIFADAGVNLIENSELDWRLVVNIDIPASLYCSVESTG